MSSLLEQFCSLLPEVLSTKYSTAKLQTRLQKHYGDTINRISILSIEKTKRKMKITSLLLHIMYVKDLQDKCD
jgi:hypothetical protein